MEWIKRYRKCEFRDKIESLQLGLKRIVSDLPLGLAVVDENRDLLFLSSMPIRNLEKGAEAGLHQYPPMPRTGLDFTLPHRCGPLRPIHLPLLPLLKAIGDVGKQVWVVGVRVVE